ncbi:Slp family lipoprotein [Rahnella sp. SAP-1]|jgi:outer membrane lipoprotein|uniref:Slp family lipoprotein n=1 Tax=Rouxiella aceris TaxID=2703884 RepID=A0A848MEX8_9GAMM|nr:Slp family lipoprotein [Rouxiella aceris]NMP26707.1 Slp family lipoprotein [Rouxiella aceris]
MRKILTTKKSLAFAVGLGALLLSGCVTVPESIRGTTETPQMNLVAVQGAPQIYVGQEARFGGRVVAVTNDKNRTRLEIAVVPLDSSAAPILGQPSVGRIAAYYHGFLDPVDFKNQLVTVVGPISGSENGTIGNSDYRYVTVNVNSYKRWREVKEVVMPPQPMGPWGWGYGGPYDPRWGRGFGPEWGGWNDAGPARVETVVTE